MCPLETRQGTVCEKKNSVTAYKFTEIGYVTPVYLDHGSSVVT